MPNVLCYIKMTISDNSICYLNKLENKGFLGKLSFNIFSTYSLTNAILNGDMKIICIQHK